MGDSSQQLGVPTTPETDREPHNTSDASTPVPSTEIGATVAAQVEAAQQTKIECLDDLGVFLAALNAIREKFPAAEQRQPENNARAMSLALSVFIAEKLLTDPQTEYNLVQKTITTAMNAVRIEEEEYSAEYYKEWYQLLLAFSHRYSLLDKNHTFKVFLQRLSNGIMLTIEQRAKRSSAHTLWETDLLLEDLKTLKKIAASIEVPRLAEIETITKSEVKKTIDRNALDAYRDADKGKPTQLNKLRSFAEQFDLPLPTQAETYQLEADEYVERLENAILKLESKKEELYGFFPTEVYLTLEQVRKYFFVQLTADTRKKINPPTGFDSFDAFLDHTKQRTDDAVQTHWHYVYNANKTTALALIQTDDVPKLTLALRSMEEATDGIKESTTNPEGTPGMLDLRAFRAQIIGNETQRIAGIINTDNPTQTSALIKKLRELGELF